MPHIKKLAMHGFKSFAKSTDILFDKGLNTIVGPNGSGKSNILDAICFVLGRLSIKSIRAAKASGLIYNGGKEDKPSQEARVDLIIDNTDKTFPGGDEVTISRIVKRDGQSVYRIDNTVKTRQEVLDLLAHAGIDPYGFNIILQNEITKFVEMHGEERRQVIEEVAGIRVYEIRRERSLAELEKTEQKLREVSAILNERFAYMKNLDKERQDALKFKELENMIKREKGSVIHKQLTERKQEKEKLEKEIAHHEAAAGKLKQASEKQRQILQEKNSQIDEINKKIQESTGVQQESLHKYIAESKADIAGLTVRLENYKQQLSELEKRNKQLEESIKQEKNAVIELKKKLAAETGIEESIKEKTLSFQDIDEKHQKYQSLKLEFMKDHTQFEHSSKQRNEIIARMSRMKPEIDSLLKEMPQQKSQNPEHVLKDLESKKDIIMQLEKSIILAIEQIARHKKEIDMNEKFVVEMNKLDVCPVCRRKVTEDHKHDFGSKIGKEKTDLHEKLSGLEKEKAESQKKIEKLKQDIKELELKHRELIVLESEFRNLTDKKNFFAELETKKDMLDEEVRKLEKSIRALEVELNRYEEFEQIYNARKGELEQLTEQQKETVNLKLDISMKEREMERMQLIIKRSAKEKEELEQKVGSTGMDLEGKQKDFQTKEKQEQSMYASFNAMFQKRNKIQDEAKAIEMEIFSRQEGTRKAEDEVHILKIAMAKIDAEISTHEAELKNYGEIQIVQASFAELQERIRKHEESLIRIGNVNLRALEAYESVKSEYDKIYEKVDKLRQEKEQIMKVIEEIDTKKKTSFTKTLETINANFNQNFATLVGKGFAFMEVENKEKPFEGGLDILVRLGKGKYADAHAFSGGEQTLMALSLIFAIQEYKPYCFYVFDEIDAALDKRNSERLAVLIKNYIGKGQYVVITHNDALISEATNLYGVTMQNGISKVLSLKL